MTTIGFIGLGVMGSPMAVHLARAGHRVTGFNRSPGKDGPLLEAGGRSAASLADAVEGAEVVCTMLPDSPDVLAILTGDSGTGDGGTGEGGTGDGGTGKGGVLDRVDSGTLLIDFSTIRPDVTVELADRAAQRGLRFVDAPVSGGEKGAVDATLSVMVGGEASHVEAARPLLDVVGSTIVHVGPSGAGQTVKAANQLLVAANLQALAEAVVFLEAHGVAAEAALEVLGGGLAGSAALEQKRQNLLGRSFEPGFRIALHHKDLGIVMAAARESGVVMPVGALVAELMASAKAVGDGDLDHSALLRGVERLSGRAPR